MLNLNRGQTLGVAIGGLLALAGILLIALPGSSVTYEAVTDPAEFQKELAEWAAIDAGEGAAVTAVPIRTQTLTGTCGSPAKEFWFHEDAPALSNQGAVIEEQMDNYRAEAEAAACADAAPPRFALPLILVFLGVGGAAAAVVFLSDRRRLPDVDAPQSGQPPQANPSGQQPPEGYWWDGEKCNPPGTV